MEPIVYLNGAFMPLPEARIPVLDRGFIFGDGVYEVVPIYLTPRGRRPFRLPQHLARLSRSLAKIALAAPHDDARWGALIAELVERNPHEGDSLVYVQVTRGVAPRAHAFPAGVAPTVFMMANPLPRPGVDVQARGVAAVTAEDLRWLRCDVKTTSLLGNVLMAQYAVEHGAAETIQLREGYLTEGASTNVWLVRNGVLAAPLRDQRILEGIRYAFLTELAAAAGIPFQARNITAAELLDADEILLSSAGKEVMAVTTLDGRPVGGGVPGPIYRTLYDGYQRAKSEA